MNPYTYFRRFVGHPDSVAVTVSDAPLPGLVAIVRGKRIENYKPDEVDLAIDFLTSRGVKFEVVNGP